MCRAALPLDSIITREVFGREFFNTFSHKRTLTNGYRRHSCIRGSLSVVTNYGCGNEWRSVVRLPGENSSGRSADVRSSSNRLRLAKPEDGIRNDTVRIGMQHCFCLCGH